MDIQKIMNYICCIKQSDNLDSPNDPVIIDNKSDKQLELTNQQNIEEKKKESDKEQQTEKVQEVQKIQDVQIKTETIDVDELKLKLSEMDSEMDKFEHITPIEMNLEIDAKYF